MFGVFARMCTVSVCRAVSTEEFRRRVRFPQTRAGSPLQCNYVSRPNVRGSADVNVLRRALPCPLQELLTEDEKTAKAALDHKEGEDWDAQLAFEVSGLTYMQKCRRLTVSR